MPMRFASAGSIRSAGISAAASAPRSILTPTSRPNICTRTGLDALTVCGLYKRRWNVELFFKSVHGTRDRVWSPSPEGRC